MMNAQTLHLLLEQLRRGDDAAAEQLVAEYEPYLRKAIRCSCPPRLRAKFDSVDVVQSVWAHVLPALRDGVWEIADIPRLRALLVTIARRRLVSRFRKYRACIEREQAGCANLDVLPEPRLPRPSELAQADELWEQLLSLCPVAHHELLRLRRQGLSLQEAATRTGMHEGSVRRVLRRLARQLALSQEPLATSSEVNP
jgi:RNA polymerase sigma factor (sigma-70 family)